MLPIFSMIYIYIYNIGIINQIYIPTKPRSGEILRFPKNCTILGNIYIDKQRHRDSSREFHTTWTEPGSLGSVRSCKALRGRHCSSWPSTTGSSRWGLGLEKAGKGHGKYGEIQQDFGIWECFYWQIFAWVKVGDVFLLWRVNVPSRS